MSNSFKNILCLTVITIIAGFGLGYVYDITAEPIRRMEEATKTEAYKSVFPEASGFDESQDPLNQADGPTSALALNGCDIDSVVIARDSAGNSLGYVINVTTHEGYGGDISLSVGIDNEGVVKGMEILDISETAGLGMKAKESGFKDQFKDKAVSSFTYTKTGAASDFEIDAISGATITTKAVTNAVNAAISCYGVLGGNN